MKIIITRHGETEENKAGIIQGHLPGVLSDLGKEQAGKLAKRLKDEKIDLIISSDLDRAHDTAKAVAEFHPNVDLLLDERLRERFLGKFQGKTKEEFGVPKTESIDDYASEGDIEYEESIFARADELIKDAMGRSEKNILFVGHDGICRAIIGSLLGIRSLKDIVTLNNTSVSVFDVKNDGVELKLLNCTEHLE